MKRSRFTEDQIIGMIKEQEAGMATAEVCRRHGLSPVTFYKLKAKYGGMDLSDAQRLPDAPATAAGLLQRPIRLVPHLLSLVASRPAHGGPHRNTMARSSFRREAETG